MTGNWAPQKESRQIVTAGSSADAHKLTFVLKVYFTELEDLKRQIISQAAAQGEMNSNCFVGK